MDIDELNIDDLFSAFNELKEKDISSESNINTKNCMQCGGDNYIHTSEGDVVCGDCGIVSSDYTPDDKAEWSNFNEGSERCEYNNNTLLRSDNMSTQIAFKRNMKCQDWNLMKWQRTLQLDPKDRTLIKVYTYIEQRCLGHNINQVTINTTKGLYKFISALKLSRGAVREAMLASCLYYAFIHENSPRNIDEVSSVFQTEPKKVNKTNKILSKYLWNSQNHKGMVVHNTQCHDIIHRYCNKMNIQATHVSNILQLSSTYCNNQEMIGKDCSYIVALAIYNYSNQQNIHVSKDDICETCFLSTVTLNKLIKQNETK